jgi:hypothetical protein
MNGNGLEEIKFLNPKNKKNHARKKEKNDIEAFHICSNNSFFVA